MENLFTTNELLISTFDGTNTKVAWAIQCLVDNCEDFNVFRENRKISEVSNKNISNLKGFTSRILLVTIVFEGGNGVPFKCVMKLPGQSIVIEEENGEDVKDEVVAAERNLYMLVHNREAMFLNKYQDIKGLRIPKCYGVKDWINKKQEGAILMNYLGDTHAHVGYFENLNVEQTQSVLDQIFILQKHFLLKRDEDWKPHFTPIVKASDYGVWIKAFEPNFTLMKSFVDESLYKDTEKEILALSSNYVEMLDYLLTVLPFEEGNQSVFAHSDSWINNFLFTKNSEGKPSNEVTLLDFQICYNGGIGNDLSNT
uniref:CHK domain-containing protein n=1 Tax=Rhabditophanes sp. KR3021 TaxID=114890 RepID=A0AC35TW15_9BILA